MKEKALKTVREAQHVTYRGTVTGESANLTSETAEADSEMTPSKH